MNFKSPLDSRCKSSVMSATTVLAVILLPLCTGHLGSLAHNGEGKPPLLNHVRVSRGPLDEYGELTKSSGTSTGRMNLIKSPSYQHKMLHMSQFHNINPNPSSPLYQHLHNPIPNQIYPVASVYMRNGVGNPGRRPGFNSNGELFTEDHQQEGGDYVLPHGDEQEEVNEQDATFTPFIGARALSNIPKFFEHIRDNLDALHLSQQLEDDENDSNSSPPLEYLETQKDLPERRGDYFMSDGRLSVNADGLGYEYDNDKPVTGEKPRMRNNDPSGHEVSRELDLLMGRDPKYKNNQYNPSWLFTNLGLGKRSHL